MRVHPSNASLMLTMKIQKNHFSHQSGRYKNLYKLMQFCEKAAPQKNRNIRILHLEKTCFLKVKKFWCRK